MGGASSQESRASDQERSTSSLIQLVAIYGRRIAQRIRTALLPFWNDSTASVPFPNRLTQEERQERIHELRERKLQYAYESPDTIPGVPFFRGQVAGMAQEMPSLFWVFRALRVILLTRINGQLNGGTLFSPRSIIKTVQSGIDVILLHWRGEDQLAAALRHAPDDTDYQMAAERLERVALRRAQRIDSNFEETYEALTPYREMHKLIARQKISDVFLQDSVFARLRTAGFNPISLFRIDEVSDTRIVPIDEARMPNDGDTLALAVKEKRLFGLDFSEFSSIKQKENNEPTRLILPAKALFVLPPGTEASGPKQLQAVAIEMPVSKPDGTFGLNGRVVYPNHGELEHGAEWEIAKMIVNVCDAIHHELIAHLGRTHLLVEPFVVSTMRQLSAKHPLHKLLRSHFEGTLFINNFAAGKVGDGPGLVSPGGNVDQLFGGDIESVMQWVADKVIANNFNASMPDTEMATRGVDDEVLDCPYREDALEHFRALHKWVGAYLKVYYRTDEELSQDPELQGWVEELVDDDGGKVRDFGDVGDGKVKTVAYLARAVSFIIFSSSVQHAAVNFPQSILMSYTPSIAGAIWQDLPPADERATLTTWRGMLPPVKESLLELDLLTILGGVYHTRLGEYGRNDLPQNARVLEALEEYKRALKTLEVKIEQREESQDLPYEFMRPSRIPQSINV